MLRAVRALRLTFGQDVERTEPRDAYLGLLRGFAALDDMWEADDRFTGLGLFTMDMFDRVVAERPDGGPGADREAYRRVLSEAAFAGPGATLAHFVSAPAAVDHALAWRKSTDFDAQAAVALDIQPDEVTEADRSRLFWARVKAEETLRAPGVDVPGLLRKVLGYPVQLPPTYSHAPLWNAYTRAFAAGRDATDPAVVAAHELELAGATADDTRQVVLLDGGWGSGRNYGPERQHRHVELSEIRTPAGREPAKWAEGPQPPSPHLVVADPDPGDPDRIVVQIAGKKRRVTLDVFIELVAADRSLMNRAEHVPVVLALPELGRLAPALAQRLADRLGRDVWWTSLPVNLTKAQAGDLSVLELTDGPAGSPAPTADAWQKTQPRIPALPAATSSGSAPQPVPSSAGRAAVRAVPGPGVAAPDVLDTQVLAPENPDASSDTDDVAAVVPDSSADPAQRRPAAPPLQSALRAEPAPLSSAAPVPASAGPVLAAPVAASIGNTPAAPAAVPARGTGTVSAPPARSSATFVPFWRASTHLSRKEWSSIEQSARRVARVAVAHRELGVSPQEVDIVGHSDGLPGTAWGAERIGTARAREVAAVFRRALERELAGLQAGLPAGQRPLRAADVPVRARYGGRRGAEGPSRTGEAARHTVIDVSGPSVADARQALRALAAREAERFGRPRMSREEQARQVLHLAGDAEVGPSVLGALYTLVGQARAAGQADSTGALAAFHLGQPGVLERLGLAAAGRTRYFTHRGERIPGLNGGEQAVTEFDPAEFDILRASADGSLTGGDAHQTAPWSGGRSYPVSAALRDGLVGLRWPDGALREQSIEETAAVVRACGHGPRRAGPRRHVTVVWPTRIAGDADLAQIELFANLVGRTVWVHTGIADLRPSSDVIRVVHQEGRPQGDWLAVRAHDPLAPAKAGQGWDREAYLRPVAGGHSHRRTGTSFFSPADLAGAREEFSRSLAQQTGFVHYNPATGEMSEEIPLRGPALQGSEYQAEHLFGHSLPGKVAQARPDGTYRMLDEGRIESWAARLLRRSRARWISLVSCWGGAPARPRRRPRPYRPGRGRRDAVRRQPAPAHLRGPAGRQRGTAAGAGPGTHPRRRPGRRGPAAARALHRRARAAHPVAVLPARADLAGVGQTGAYRRAAQRSPAVVRGGPGTHPGAGAGTEDHLRPRRGGRGGLPPTAARRRPPWRACGATIRHSGRGARSRWTPSSGRWRRTPPGGRASTRPATARCWQLPTRARPGVPLSAFVSMPAVEAAVRGLRRGGRRHADRAGAGIPLHRGGPALLDVLGAGEDVRRAGRCRCGGCRPQGAAPGPGRDRGRGPRGGAPPGAHPGLRRGPRRRRSARGRDGPGRGRRPPPPAVRSVG